MSLPKELEFDWQAAREDIATAIRYHFKNTGATKGVIGLSGGVDSSVTAWLAAYALGSENTLALILPEEGVTPQADVKDALKVAKQLGIEHKTIGITPGVETFTRLVPEVAKTDAGEALLHSLAYANIKARVRMILLYAHANIIGGAQVIGTGDKSELLLGYCTKYGDHGVDLLPIGDLYKTQVLYMAKMLKLPESVWRKKPSPRLLRDQTAEGEIGVGYDVIDRVLYHRVEERYPEEKIAEELGVSRGVVKKLCRMITQSHHKRKAPPICKLGSSTINWDWRMPVE